MNQTTILFDVHCSGIGIHSGRLINLSLKPLKANSGIVFKRTDVQEEISHIEAKYYNVKDTSLCTTISNNYGVSISTTEHLMAAIFAMKIDNLLIEADGSEVPIMDGSSAPFIFLLECAQANILQEKRKYLKILKGVEVKIDNTYVTIEPSDNFSVNMNIDFSDKFIGTQAEAFDFSTSFKYDFAYARTFGFIKDLEHLRNRGLAKGASLENCIGIDGDKILNPEGLRYKNEFAKHKLLDAIGDLYTSGHQILGKVTCNKSGHKLNNEALHLLFSKPDCYKLVSTF